YQWGPNQVDIGAYNENVYIAYNDYSTDKFLIKLAYSTDYGSNWNKIEIDTINFGNSLLIRYDLPRILVGNNGVYIFYFVFQNSSDTSGIYMYKFPDGIKKKIDNFFPSARYEYAITPFVTNINNQEHLFISYWIDSSFYIIHSTNGGLDFSTPSIIQSVDVMWPFFDWQTTFQSDNQGTIWFKYDYQKFEHPSGYSRKFFVTKSTNIGQNWSEPILIDTSMNYVDFKIVGNKFIKYFVTNDWNLYMSSSLDLINWSELMRINTVDSSVRSNYPAASKIKDKIAFAWIDRRTGNDEIFYRLMDIPTLVNKDLTHVNLKLNQNYPNPFNSMTEISFSINQRSQTLLKVYDIFGKTVKILVDNIFEPGYYQIKFDGENLSSGIYFYELSLGKTRVTKKMIMIK
ncbi:MAG: T9SS type A sorting domain-containing protein, partial [Ignavibacteria bacterium]